MISGINPSFKGIVKVSRIMVDGRPSYYYKDFDSCGLQLKNILLKRTDTKTTTQKLEEFRQTYKNYDPDYTPPEFKVDGNTASIMAKVRTGKNTFIVSGADAKYIDDAGFNIGRKHNLERCSEEGENVGVEDAAREAYIAAKEELPGKFLSKERAYLGHPQVILYAERNSKGKPILKGAMLKNDFDQTQIFSFKPEKKTVEKADKHSSQNIQVQSKPQPQVQPKPTQNPVQEVKKEQEENRDFFEHLKNKSWNPALLKPKKSRKRRKPENPNQLFLNI